MSDFRLTDQDGNPLRLLMVHAHPDDETTTTGATAARYAAEGIEVHLVTCTRGERGEVLAADLAARLERLDQDTAARQLAEYRAAELAAACGELGLTSWRFLGGPGQWWDSGMAGTPTQTHPKAFSQGELAAQAVALAVIIRQLRPQVVITYDERGGYGHPDHIRTHQVTMAAVRMAAGPGRPPGEGRNCASWQASKVYACVIPYSYLRPGRGSAALDGAGVQGPNPLAADPDSVADVPFAVPDELVAARIDAGDWLPAKARAMRAHRSQMPANGWFFALVDRGLFGIEHYRLLAGQPAPPAGERWENDLFAGIRAAGTVRAGTVRAGTVRAGTGRARTAI
jgi:N-acetyl-1-D-myo-inositol-2-amino-2-deoxy-alpha-D-glucopyranoside deacetylase